ncbi:hypothetical protein Pelo_1461 [Pelomyxa schiedti]|nr:hypothetical protein Pelo_1461 [Pelomyxa schiedti]
MFLNTVDDKLSQYCDVYPSFDTFQYLDRSQRQDLYHKPEASLLRKCFSGLIASILFAFDPFFKVLEHIIMVILHQSELDVSSRYFP